MEAKILAVQLQAQFKAGFAVANFIVGLAGVVGGEHDGLHPIPDAEIAGDLQVVAIALHAGGIERHHGVLPGIEEIGDLKVIVSSG